MTALPDVAPLIVNCPWVPPLVPSDGCCENAGVAPVPVSMVLAAPAATLLMAEVPLPSRMEFPGKVAAPVPPRLTVTGLVNATVQVPEVVIAQVPETPRPVPAAMVTEVTVPPPPPAAGCQVPSSRK